MTRRLHQPRRRMRGGEAGFTLVEILVVITIIGLIMALVGPRVLNYLAESKVKAARIQVESFASSLDLFYLDAGRYPTTSEGLVALTQRPGGIDAWNGNTVVVQCVSASRLVPFCSGGKKNGDNQQGAEHHDSAKRVHKTLVKLLEHIHSQQ